MGYGRHYYCDACSVPATKAGVMAARAVHREIRAGRMQPARSLMCADCGAQASEYDHRDYSKPLQVDPVCLPCNRRRGPAKH